MATGKISKYQKKSSKYKYVGKFICEKGVIKWRTILSSTGFSFDTEREAAICVDKILIARRKEPVNILVRKSV